MRNAKLRTGAGVASALLPSLLGFGGAASAAPLALSFAPANPVPATWLADKDGYLSEEEALAVFFPAATEFRRGVALPEGLAKADLRGRDIPRHYFRHAAYKNGELLGFAVIDNVPGKARPITYMLATDAPDAKGQVRILGVEILVYRESHGFEVGRDAFRKQFAGKSAADAIALKDDIRNVAGATISCRSVTDGVHDLLALIHATPSEVQAAEVQVDLDATPQDQKHEHQNATHLTRTRLLMNAPLRISIGLPAESDGAEAAFRERAIAITEQAFQLVAGLEAELSRYQESSSIAQLNAQAPSDSMPISDAVFEVLERTQYWSKESNGALSPTAGALFRLWKDSGEAPSDAAIEAARKLGGAGALELTPRESDSAPSARLTRRGAELDLGGSAKGFALDRVRALLVKNGIEQACLDFGGQLYVLGDAHAVTLRDTSDSLDTLSLSSGSLATTGDEERGLVYNGGVSHSHVIDPRTGRPAVGSNTVTVFADSALDADALSTLLFVLDFEQAKAFAESRGIAARFAPTVQRSKDQTPQPLDTIHTTSAWNRRFCASE